MNPLMEEYLIEEHRRDIKREVSHIRLQEQALKSRVFRPNWFTRGMQRLGQWLIVQGERLVKHYEVPANKCQSSKQSYAH
jgi:hypothetical protein